MNVSNTFLSDPNGKQAYEGHEMNAEEALELLQMQLDSESEEYDDEDRDPSYSLPKARQSSDTVSCDKDTDQ
ncbi:hypothetical protein ElyMa_006537200 [Elysia marginata]|uniref:Uncharacterized protein n=1 Tax=Elysia marginata TaxID=1093978 RepID=A0AAV4IBZ0_9GAST|nr:hypothetical protein ElyMa_006537200 [Elysia marginata]